MTDGEVLELNADGEFVIPSKPTTRIKIEEEDSDDGIPTKFSPTSKPIVEVEDNGVLDYIVNPEEKFKNLVGDIQPGYEYTCVLTPYRIISSFFFFLLLLT